MKTFLEIGTEIGALVEEKNAAYGSSFERTGEFLALLYPNGLQPEQFDTALLLVRIFDKQMRIATDNDAFGESPFRDIAGYGILGAYLDQKRKELCTGSASGPAATHASKEQPASAAPTSERTTTSASASSVSVSTLLLSGEWDEFFETSKKLVALSASLHLHMSVVADLLNHYRDSDATGWKGDVRAHRS